MLGKSWEEDDHKRASSWFQNVRALAATGFVDSLGLASSSLGWEARLQLREKRYAPAIDLYLEQAASGDPSAVNSLRFAASAAMQRGARALRPLAAHPRAQRVITAYVISGCREPVIDVDGPLKEPILELAAKSSYLAPRITGWHTFKAPVQIWLESVEAAKIRDVDSAEQLALAAYQAGKMDMAQRWVLLSRSNSITAQWIQAKLLMRDGKINQAAAILARLSALFPTWSAETNRPARLESNLIVDAGYPYPGELWLSAPSEVLGELGALRVARREFSQALDALLRSNFYMDADYVAECVLTADELKTYVDRHWPGYSVADKEAEQAFSLQYADGAPGAHIRDLLARRLTRSERFDEARNYCSDRGLLIFDQYVQSLRLGRDQTNAPDARAKSLWQAAQLLIQNGWGFYAPATGPDWHYSWGLQGRTNPFEFGPSATNRLSLTNLSFLTPTDEERRRVSRNVAQPEKNFHYRYAALDLAWAAVELMPNNSDETARLLYTAGSWIKALDPKAADRFYKALVRRCGKTAIGAEADRKHWFPKLDANGNVLPPQPAPTTPETVLDQN